MPEPRGTMCPNLGGTDRPNHVYQAPVDKFCRSTGFQRSWVSSSRSASPVSLSKVTRRRMSIARRGFRRPNSRRRLVCPAQPGVSYARTWATVWPITVRVGVPCARTLATVPVCDRRRGVPRARTWATVPVCGGRRGGATCPNFRQRKVGDARAWGYYMPERYSPNALT